MIPTVCAVIYISTMYRYMLLWCCFLNIARSLLGLWFGLLESQVSILPTVHRIMAKHSRQPQPNNTTVRTAVWLVGSRTKQTKTYACSLAAHRVNTNQSSFGWRRDYAVTDTHAQRVSVHFLTIETRLENTTSFPQGYLVGGQPAPKGDLLIKTSTRQSALANQR